ncbi:MAG: ABC transporter ATP-binding protein/permease [Clostridia bacterium]|nr:ABC transporter ATP-binding protein/permease [Clostridia bacterium]
MLQIKNVSKTYRTGAFVQKALADVSLGFRDSEFVAILGQSGSGKTTLLNVIGGLDRYDEGDLLINGVSTKKYKSRDWDTYRNHSVGFVFQSYNLIPHQSVLSNVELALTIGGVSKTERKRRAREALDKVGLSDHIYKKPSQLSGGQMQRVAIARALVNDPDILLADEPTGALDSDTSTQVMDLLKEVARDRLVVMVTHNPELAQKYATRIVNLKDGRIVSDSDPFEPDETVAEERPRKRSGMSFLTALNLSLNNLWTKKVRTLLVAFAGSIGIIGIAMILSMSNGANEYIRNIQEETLKSYPLQITDTSFNLASMMSLRGTAGNGGPSDEGSSAEVREWRAVTGLFSHVSNNDLKSLKQYFESGKTDIDKYVQTIQYDYNVTPQIFTVSNGKIRQVNPDRSFAALGFSATDTMSNMMTTFSSTSSFYVMPSDPALYEGQYEVKAGRWPQKYNECVLVLTQRGFVADLTLYTMGKKDPSDLDEMIKAFAEGYSSDVEDVTRDYTYDEFVGVTFKLINSADRYTYDEDFGVWSDRSEDEEFMRELVEGGEDLKIVGVVQPKEDNSSPLLNIGIAYSASLPLHLMENARNAEIVKAQLADPDKDVFTGALFGEDSGRSSFDLSRLFKVDEEALSKAFGFDADAVASSLGTDLSSLDLSDIDLSGMDFSDSLDPAAFSDLLSGVGSFDPAELMGLLKINATEEDMSALFEKLISGYTDYSAKDPSTDYSKLPEAFASYLATEDAWKAIIDGVNASLEENGAMFIDADDISALFETVFADFSNYASEHPEDAGNLEKLVSDYLATDAVKEMTEGAAEEFRSRLSAFVIKPEQAQKIGADVLSSYSDYASKNSLPDPASLTSSFASYLSSDEAQGIITGFLSDAIDTDAIEERLSGMMTDYSGELTDKIASAVKDAVNGAAGQLGGVIRDKLGGLAGGIENSLRDAFNFDPDALAGAIGFNMSAGELRDFMTSVLTNETGNYKSNLKKLGYAEEDDPSMITIYPVDFEGKTAVKKIIDGYNDQMEKAGDDEKVIVYTDIVDTLMSSVTTIINAISGVLVAFVAVSLIVSSVMIGVITYISVLERKKEIGILRSIGASKRNISNVFNAETFIIGALAGVLGIAVTSVLLVPANHIIHSLAGQNDINAILPPFAGVVLILLSIVLTLIGGIIPSRKAAKSDPVAALRSE